MESMRRDEIDCKGIHPGMKVVPSPSFALFLVTPELARWPPLPLQLCPRVATIHVCTRRVEADGTGTCRGAAPHHAGESGSVQSTGRVPANGHTRAANHPSGRNHPANPGNVIDRDNSTAGSDRDHSTAGSDRGRAPHVKHCCLPPPSRGSRANDNSSRR